MTRSKTLLLCFVLMGTTLSAQTLFTKQIEGRVYSESGDVAATHVLNITSDKASITDLERVLFDYRQNSMIPWCFLPYSLRERPWWLPTAFLKARCFMCLWRMPLTELDEVIVMPYNLTGDMTLDLDRMQIEPVVTASTLGLPNAYVKIPTQAERELFAATANPFMSFDPLINAITGRTKMLKERIARNKKYQRTQRVRAFYADSLYGKELKIPEDNIADFMYFCEVDPDFQTVVDTHDRFKIWEFMRKKSLVYRENNNLE